MAVTQTLNAKYPDWTQEDWDRIRWSGTGLSRCQPKTQRATTMIALGCEP
jgi:hypothetical protein